MSTQHTPSRHSNTVGGSSASRVIACPASLLLVKEMPEQEESVYAAEGTALHNCLEHALTEGLTLQELPQLVGQTFYDTEMTHDHIQDAVIPAWQQFMDYLDRIEEEDASDAVYGIEQEVAFPGIEGAFGTADIVGHTAGRSFIIDWKFGAGVPVSAQMNAQLLYYAAASAHSIPELFFGPGCGDLAQDAEWPVDIVICQPRLQSELSLFESQISDLDNFKKTLLKAVDEGLNAAEPTARRGDHCRWCAAQPICPLYRQVGEKLARVIEGNPPKGTPPHEIVETNAPLDPVDRAVITPDLLAHWLLQADIVEGWAKSVRKLAMEEANAGRPPRDMKLVEKMGNLAYTNPEGADKMLANKGLSASERRKVTPITPTQANALLKKKGKKLLTIKQAKRFVTGVTLAPLDDPRPALMSAADAAASAGSKLQEMQELQEPEKE